MKSIPRRSRSVITARTDIGSDFNVKSAGRRSLRGIGTRLMTLSAILVERSLKISMAYPITCGSPTGLGIRNRIIAEFATRSSLGRIDVGHMS
jgi:hypothetical protein